MKGTRQCQSKGSKSAKFGNEEKIDTDLGISRFVLKRRSPRKNMKSDLGETVGIHSASTPESASKASINMHNGKGEKCDTNFEVRSSEAQSSGVKIVEQRKSPRVKVHSNLGETVNDSASPSRKSATQNLKRKLSLKGKTKEVEKKQKVQKKPTLLKKVVKEKKGKDVNINKKVNVEIGGPSKNNTFRSSFSMILKTLNELTIENDFVAQMERTTFGPLFKVLSERRLNQDNVQKYNENIIAVLMSYSKEAKGFNIGGKLVKFTIQDVSVILGLPMTGERFRIHSRFMFNRTAFIRKYWSDKKAVSTKEIRENLRTAYKNRDYEDFARIFIMMLVMTVLSTSGTNTMGFSFVYWIEDLDKTFIHGWANTIHLEIMEALDKWDMRNPYNFHGCSILLLYFLCEHVDLIPPIIGNERIIPRFARWSFADLKNKFPISALDEIDADMVHEELRDIMVEEVLTSNYVYEEIDEKSKLKAEIGRLTLVNKSLKDENVELKNRLDQLERRNWSIVPVQKKKGEEYICPSPISRSGCHTSENFFGDEGHNYGKDSKDCRDNEREKEVEKSFEEVEIQDNEEQVERTPEKKSEEKQGCEEEEEVINVQKNSFKVVKKRETRKKKKLEGYEYEEQRKKSKKVVNEEDDDFVEEKVGTKRTRETARRLPKVDLKIEVEKCKDVIDVELCKDEVRTKVPDIAKCRKQLELLEDEEKRLVMEFLKNGYQEQIVWYEKNLGLELHGNVIISLLYGCFLSDEVIDWYAYDLKQKVQNKEDGSLFFSPTLQQSVGQCNEKFVEEHLVKVLVETKLSKTHMFFPLNVSRKGKCLEGNHWTLLQLDMKKKQWYHYNSLQHKNKYNNKAINEAKCYRSELETYIEKAASTIGYGAVEFQVKLKVVDCPSQGNSSHCGLYVCKFMETIAIGGAVEELDESMTLGEMPSMRAKIAYRILSEGKKICLKEVA